MRHDKLEAVMRAGWEALDSFSCVIEPLKPLHAAMHEADPDGVYKPGAPSAGDMEETQDIPLRDCPVLARDPEDAL
jgi:hypothetical protein